MGGNWLVAQSLAASSTNGLDAEPLIVKYGVSIGMLILFTCVIGYLYLNGQKATKERTQQIQQEANERVARAEKERDEAMAVAKAALDTKELQVEMAKATSEQSKMVVHVFESFREATERHLPPETQH